MKNRDFLLKFAEVFFLFIVLIGLLEQVDVVVEQMMAIVNDWTKIGLVFAALCSTSLLIAYFWQKSGKGESLHHYFQTIVIFYVAYEISNYGLAKILQTQFQPPHYVLDTPIGELGGFWLTWTYFGYSQTFAFILGGTQVLGSFLLLFRYTRLIGVFILFPVMVNINLVNHFYDISRLAYYNAIHYTWILMWLMCLDYDKLKAAFLSHQEKIKVNINTILLNLLRILVLGASFWYIYGVKSKFQPPTQVNGAWKVETATQDSLWSKIYFEWRYGCVFKYHPEKNQAQDLYGKYEVDEQNQRIAVKFSGQDPKSVGDSLQMDYQLEGDSLMTIKGLYQKDSLIMKLKKLPRPENW